MKKLSYLPLALLLTVFVACKGKEQKDEGMPGEDDSITMSVEEGASEALSEKQRTEEILNQSSNDELFGTDVSDEEVDNATN